MGWRRPVLVAVALCLAVTQPLSAVAAQLASHRAGYVVSLGKVREGGTIADASGIATMTVERSCNGYVLNQRLSMRLETSEGKAVDQDIQFSSWESIDGRTYRFTAENRTNGDQEVYKGTAKTAAKGGEAVYSEPDDRRFALPAGIVYPVGLTRVLIDQAKAGKTLYDGKLFDGSDGTGPQEVTAFISPLQSADKIGFASFGPLLKRPGWPMRLAFYGLGTRGPEPQYEIGMLQLDNGVVPRMVLDYESFSVILTLKKIEVLPEPDC